MAKLATAPFAASAIIAFATTAAGQDFATLQHSSAPVAADRSSQIQMQVKAHAAELRRAWIAAGHPAGPPPDNTSTCEFKPGGKNKILTPKLDAANPPAAPKIQVQIDNCPAAGFSGVYLYLYSMSNSSQYVYVQYYHNSYAPPERKITAEIQNPASSYHAVFSPYSIADTYNLASAYIYDQEGNYHSYSQTDLASVFPSTTVKFKNGLTPDGNAPMFLSGTVVTPKVSKSSSWPAFETKLKVSDDVSGLLYAWVYVCPPSGSGANCISDYVYPPAPVLTGTVKNFVYLCDLNTHDCSGVPKGTWTINGYGGCDVVYNCFSDYDSTGIQDFFGTTTFVVAK